MLTFVAIRAVHVTEFDQGHLNATTGVELPTWYEHAPLLAAGLKGDGLLFVTQVVDPIGQEGHITQTPRPGYRFTRIGYPLSAKILTGGKDDLAPIGLFVMSTVGVAMAAWAADRMRDQWGSWAWLLVANPAIIIGYIVGTAEPLGIGLAALALTKGPGWGAAMATVRPDLLTTLIHKPRAFIAGVSAAIVVALTGIGLFGSIGRGVELTFPLVGYVTTPSVSASLLALIAAVVVSVGTWRQDWSWILSGLLVLMFAAPVLEHPVNAWRTSGMLWLVLATSVTARDRERRNLHRPTLND